jgi:serine protease Do
VISGGRDNLKIIFTIWERTGVGQTVTAGIISAKGRATGLSDGSFESFLQTDAPINRGNSGGAPVNTAGELVGINSQILSPTGVNIGIGFTIPVNMARNVTDQLISTGKVRRGKLGVTIQTITSDLAASLGLSEVGGVIVSGVESGGLADRAGIKQGDVITAIKGRPVEDSNSLRNQVASTQPGTEVTLTVRRDGSEQEMRVKLGELSVEAIQAGSDRTKGGSGGLYGLLELPNKINLSREDYLTVQQIYRGWALLGVVVAGALLSTLVLAIMVGKRPKIFILT